jgi:hypothetical protein
MRVYLAGPMTGIPEFNFPAFHEAAKTLREAGHEVFSPAEADERRYGVGFTKNCIHGHPAELFSVKFNLRQALAEDLEYICNEAEAIALLPGWEQSSGAMAEFMAARALKLRFIYFGVA